MKALRTLGLLLVAAVLVVVAAYAAFGVILYSFDQATYTANTTAVYDYDEVLTTAESSGYAVERVDSVGFHPDGVTALDAALGDDYEVTRVVFHHESGVELHLTVADGDRTELVVYGREYTPVDSDRLPPAWLTDRLQLALGVDRATAEGYVDELRSRAADGETPQTYADERLRLAPVYAAFEAEGSPIVRTSGDGQGGVVYQYTTDGADAGELWFVVGRAELTDRDGRWTYVLNVDRAGTIGVTVHGPPGAERAEGDLRESIRDRFAALGIPPDAAADLTFEYDGSVW
ncbi:hypothetical protein [Salinirubrum litoreum]|uniref:DUF4825 domain-containing protein n=1 Tax=Salinirubrum litoreum TaxID=1126234 RepID=A0ABD5RGD7_9EURY|nr:hypothetical protein [Salinirubrum litoreum]